MNIRAEFELQKGGLWMATVPGNQEVSGYGPTRQKAAADLIARVLDVLASDVRRGRLTVEMGLAEEAISLPEELEDRLATVLLWLLAGLDAGHTPNTQTRAAIEELERGGGKSFRSIEELVADLNADD